jgi:fructokinase
MHSEDLFSVRKPSPVVVGTGLVALDVVIPGDAGTMPHLWAGGTCGNVLAVLAYLGWEVYPVARLGQDSPAHWIAQDFTAWGLHLEFLVRESRGATPVIVQRIRRGGPDAGTHSFSWRCPFCGSDLPRYRPFRLTDLDQLIPQLPRSDAFFFDRVSPSTLRLAEHYAARGALIVLEPSSVGDPRLFRDALGLVHVLKFSNERLGNSVEALTAEQPWLVVETLGQHGLRYRCRLPAIVDHGWQHLGAFPIQDVRDTAGSGDWCTAGILHVLGAGGLSEFLCADGVVLQRALRFGQALAAWNCGFEAPRGGMYSVTKRAFEESIRGLLSGSMRRNSRVASRPGGGIAQQFACSACPPGKKPHKPNG